MAAPPYDDTLYLKVFKALAEKIEYPGFIDRIMQADSPHLIIRAFKELE
jgi:mannitol/fructose-specific phosphotransferase system IIA component (Ntr-type)